MKKLLALVLTVSVITGFTQNITTPRTPSPAASVSQTIGISTVTVKYSRPSVRGREVWGAMVPYGYNLEPYGNNIPAPWRAGANENTVLELSHDAKIEGQPVPAGAYGLFFAVNKDNTAELVLSKDYKSWGNYFYNPANDQLRAKIQLRDIPGTELLTYDFANITKNAAELQLSWEKKQFPVKIEFAVDDIVLANAETELKGGMGFTWEGYSSAANYALQNKTHYDQALVWIDKALAQNKNFTTLQTKADILAATGKADEGKKLMEDALANATEGNLNQYGYQLLLNEGKTDKALEIFVLNTQKNPRSANAWDSLGEAYNAKGDKKNAIASFKKSLTLNPNAATKANSEKYLKQLEGK